MKRPAAYFRLRLSLARLLRGLGWPSAEALAERLSFTRSAYGPELLIVPGERTFDLSIHGYGRFISDAIAGQDRPFIFLDVGANLGLFSLLAARNANCRRVIAIEPLPAIFARLQANVRHSGAGTIELLQGAIHAGSAGQVAMSFNPAHTGMSQVLEAGSAGIMVPVIAAGVLDEQLACNGERIVAKIDVEGSEIDVIAVLRRMRSYSRVSEIVIEISERNLGNERRDRLLQMLAEDGFAEHSRAGEPAHYDAWYRRNCPEPVAIPD